MEDNRDRLVVILAGYTNEMRALLRDANAGLSSRIPVDNFLIFEDYTADELFEIFTKLLERNDFTIEEDAAEMVRTVIKKHIGDENFGNARFVRNIFESIYRSHADNSYNLEEDDKMLTTITTHDCASALKSY